MRKLNSDIKFLAILLTMVMLFQTMPLALYAEEEGIVPLDSTDLKYGETYTAEFAVDSFIPFARSPFVADLGKAVPIAELPAEFSVMRTKTDEFYYIGVSDENWPAEYAEYKYIFAPHIVIVDENGNEINWMKMALNVEYTATWADGVSDVSPYRRAADSTPEFIAYIDIYNVSGIDVTSEFPSKLSVKFMYEEDVEEEILYVTNEDWPEWLEDFRYLNPWDLNVFAPSGESVSLEKQLGSFTASVSGATIPDGADLQLGAIAESDFDPNLGDYITDQMGALLGAYDMWIKQSDGTEWQPGAGETVTVTMNAAAWGLSMGDEIHIIHVHTNTDGTKDYQIIGPVFKDNSEVIFELDSFSDFYLFRGNQGNASLTNNQNDTYYVEPGTTITFEQSPTWTLITEENVNISANGNTITVGTKAQIGDTVTYSATWGSGNNRGSCAITIQVCSRADVVTNYGSKDIIFAALDQVAPAVTLMGFIQLAPAYEITTFPSEPTATGNRAYLRLSDVTNPSLDNLYSTQYCNQLTSSGNIFNINGKTAADYLDLTYMASASSWAYDPEGSQIAGLVDPTGVQTTRAFEVNGVATVNWDVIKYTIAKFNEANTSNPLNMRYEQETSSGFTTIGVILSTDEQYKLENYPNGLANGDKLYYEDVKLIPYVIKLMSDGWHVDMAVIHEDSYVLSYDLNMGNYISEAIFLPDARVYVEDPNDNDSLLTIQIASDADWVADTTKVNATDYYSSPVRTGDLIFKGWSTNKATLPTDTDNLYQAGDDLVMSGSTTLYAIWQLPDGWNRPANTISVLKTVFLADGSQFGAKIPQPGESKYERFSYNINLSYDSKAVAVDNNGVVTDDGAMQAITFEAYIYEKQSDNSYALVKYVDTFANMIANNVTYDFITINITQAGVVTSVDFKLGNGEAMHFHEVPVDLDDSTEEGYQEGDTYTITETISNNVDYFATSTATGKTITHTTTMRFQNVASMVDFYNYYVPPVAGLQISAVLEEATASNSEYFMYEVTGTDGESSFKCRVAVPAGGSVTITNLLTTNWVYTVTDLSWNASYSEKNDKIQESNIKLQDGASVTAQFNYEADGKWLFGHGISVKK